MSKLGVLAFHIFSEENKQDIMFIATGLFQGRWMTHFSKISLQVWEKCIFYENVQRKKQLMDEGELACPTQGWSFLGEKLCFVYGGISLVLFISAFETLSGHLIQIYNLNSCNVCMKIL